MLNVDLFPVLLCSVNSKMISFFAFLSFLLKVQVTATYQYFLRKQDLPLLHAAFDIYYEDVMETKGVDALKVNTIICIDFSLEYTPNPNLEKQCYKPKTQVQAQVYLV